jgi:hypothetical protein
LRLGPAGNGGGAERPVDSGQRKVGGRSMAKAAKSKKARGRKKAAKSRKRAAPKVAKK